MFIDYLDIEHVDREKTQLIVFFWVSWGGKSTYLDVLKKKEKDYMFLFHKEAPLRYQKTDKKIVFIDEIVYMSQLYIVLRYVLEWKKVVVATHLPLYMYKILFFFCQKKLFSTEDYSQKITTYLHYKSIESNERIISVFMKKYKWSFAVLHEMLDNYPEEKDFETIYTFFHRECSIEIKDNY